jgi:hypothetical protein
MKIRGRFGTFTPRPDQAAYECEAEYLHRITSMKLRTHTCRATGCQHVISTRLLMCIDHWRMVPAPLRREIVDLSKQLRRDRSAVSGSGWPAVNQYRDAVARAVAAVEEKQERKAAAIAGPSGSLFT